MFCNHTAWRTHGRSLKREDLKEDLLIERIEDDAKLADIVYRIKTVIRLIFDGSTVYKLFFVEDLKISKTFSITPRGNIPVKNQFEKARKGKGKTIEMVELELHCPKCNTKHVVTGYLNLSSEEILEHKMATNPNIKNNDILVCHSCEFAIDLKPMKNQVESQTKRKIVFK